jgi:para-aminobenzoate synthetase component 1
MEFYAENAIIDPLDKFLKLNDFSTSICFFKTIANFAASPERLEKEGELLFHNL